MGVIRGATVADVASSASSVGLFAASAGAYHRFVFNDSSAILYLKYGTTASTTSYTVQIPAGGFYEFPRPIYDGPIAGVWASANGFARTTEVL